MNEFPKISVIMPVYNESTHDLQESINSILNQTYKNFEFIIIDDNPSSAPIKLFLLKESKIDKRIKLIFNKYNLGVIRSSNKGMYIATGTYLSRMDADDIARKDKLYIQLIFINKYDLDFVCSNFSIINNEDKITKKCGYKCPTIINQYNIRNILQHCNIAIGPTLFFKKRLFWKLNGYRNTNVEDYDLVSRFLIHNYKVGYQDYNLLFKRLRNSSISFRSIYVQYIIMKIMGAYLKYDKIAPLSFIRNKVKNINLYKLQHFNKFVTNRYLFNDKKSILNVCKLIISIVTSVTVINWCLWSIKNKLFQYILLFKKH